LLPHFATPDGRMIISFQCFVLRSQGRTVMIDTCIGADREREFPVFTNLQTTFLEDLAAAGYPHASVTDVLCTHLHFDHVGWNTRRVDGQWVPTFPQARYLFGRREWEHWKFLRDTNGYHHMEHLKDAIDPVMAAGLVQFIEPDFRITDEVSLIPTPGHTPGHVSVLIQSRGESAVITGDMMHNPIQIAVPATEARFDMDKAAAARTRVEFVNRFNGSRTLVIGSHFSDPSAGHIVADGTAWKLKVD
jgi:glyoxylase-like metal-dependent hydrolase (beta-lactamase superfamily II)